MSCTFQPFRFLGSFTQQTNDKLDTMKRIEFLIGVERDANERKVDRVKARLANVREILTGAYNAFTEFDSRGYWDGVSERGRVFVVLADSDALKARGVARLIARAMKQQCVGLSICEASFHLIAARDEDEHKAPALEAQAHNDCIGMRARQWPEPEGR